MKIIHHCIRSEICCQEMWLAIAYFINILCINEVWRLDFQKFDSFASPMRLGHILLKCEVIGVLLNIGKKISCKQYLSIILTIRLNAGINEVKVCSSKCRHTTCRTSESRDTRLHSTKFVATQQSRSKPSRLQNLGLTAGTGLQDKH